MEERRPLSGVRIIEMGNAVAGPSCGKLLADWGAEVIKVESSYGDTWRVYGRIVNVPCTAEENPLFDMFNGGKKCVSLDLNTEGGQRVMQRLLESSDVLLTSFREKAMKKQGLDYASLKEKYPRLIYAILTGYGDKGPKKDDPGYDLVAFWGITGFLADQGIVTPGSYPILPPGGIGDITASVMLYGAIVSALYAREKTGKGDRVTVSLYGAALHVMSVIATVTQDRFKAPYPRTRQQTTPYMNPYKCADGEWLQISIMDYAKDYRNFVSALGIPEYADDPRYATVSGCRRNRVELIEKLEEQFLKKTCAQWQEILSPLGIVNDRLGHYREIQFSEQARANGYTVDHTSPNGNRCMIVRPAMQADSMPMAEPSVASVVGGDTVSVLHELGYGDAEIDALLSSKAILQS